MKVLIDTNIALDFLLHRKDYAYAATVFSLAENNVVFGFIPASAITDIFYLAKKVLGNKQTKEELKKLLQVFCPATVTDDNIYEALNLDWDDFEDSVQFVVGKSFSADYIVTRDTIDYSSGTITAIEPDKFVKLFKKDDDEEENNGSGN
jgi:predicted nucleic acid-binding protein